MSEYKANTTGNKTDSAALNFARSAQSLYKDVATHCMNGKSADFRSAIQQFSSQHPQVSLQEMFLEFKSEGRTLLHIACSCGNLEIVDFILKSCNKSYTQKLLSAQDDKGFTPLINSVVSENDQLISKLLTEGSDVNTRNADGAAAIHFAAGDGSVPRMQKLVEAGAKLDFISTSGTPLHWAAGKGRSEAIKYLISQKVDVNAVGSDKLPAVIMAAVASCDEGAKYLVEAGADVGTILSGNLTVLHISSENGLKSTVDSLLRTETGKTCCQIPTSEGNLPIHLAAMAGHRDIVASLLTFAPATAWTSDISGKLGQLSPAVVNDSNSSEMREILDLIMAEGAKRMDEWNRNHEEQKLKQKQERDAALAEEEKKKNSTTVSTAEIEDIMRTMKDCSAEDASLAEKHKDDGNKYYVQKDYPRAIEEYSASIRLNNQVAAYWSNRSACFLALNDAWSALRDAEICRRLKPDWPRGCYRLAAARLALNQFEDAAVAAFEGCKLDNSNKELKALLQTAVKKGQEDHKSKLQSTAGK